MSEKGKLPRKGDTRKKEQQFLSQKGGQVRGNRRPGALGHDTAWGARGELPCLVCLLYSEVPGPYQGAVWPLAPSTKQFRGVRREDALFLQGSLGFLSSLSPWYLVMIVKVPLLGRGEQFSDFGEHAQGLVLLHVGP